MGLYCFVQRVDKAAGIELLDGFEKIKLYIVHIRCGKHHAQFDTKTKLNVKFDKN